MEKRQKELRRQALIRHRVEEEKKFEDKGFLKAYFKGMREQIDTDIRNSKRYFPVPLQQSDTLQPNELYANYRPGSRRSTSQTPSLSIRGYSRNAGAKTV